MLKYLYIILVSGYHNLITFKKLKLLTLVSIKENENHKN